MKTLGIDYGRSKVGLALGLDSFAEPYKVIRYKRSLASQSPGKDIKILSGEIKKIVEQEKIDKVVVGISKGQMAEEIKKFIFALRPSLLPIPCEVYDETLTSKDAQRLSIEAGVSQKKRHELEDAYAASIILQNYLDSK